MFTRYHHRVFASLADMTKKFSDLMGKIKIGSDTAEKLKRTFAGVFAVFGIGWDLIKGLFSSLGQLFGTLSNGSGGFLNLTARIGDFLVKLKKSIESGNGLTKFFQGLGKVLSIPIILVQEFAAWLDTLFNKIGSGGKKSSSSVSGISGQFSLLSKAARTFSGIWDKIGSGID